MAPTSKKDALKRWQERVQAANRAYDRWADRFEVKRLEQYYEGLQWRGLSESAAKEKYTINLVFPTVETQLPSLYFDRPVVKVEAKPGHANDPQSKGTERADLLKNALQTYIDDEDFGFAFETDLALRDAFARFGVVEVGYSADYLDNPNAGKPVLKEEDDDAAHGDDGDAPRDRTMRDGAGQPVLQPDSVLDAESLFVKRIPASQVRVSVSGRNRLETNDWVGYYEWHYVEDLKRNTKYKHRARLQPSGVLSDTTDTTIEADADPDKYTGMVRVWKIWDLRAKVKRVWADGNDVWLLEGEPYTYLPLAPLKFFELTDEFYPLPPIYNWLSPQDEINESREMQRVHRKRFTRRYTVLTGAIDPSELEKLESGEDGVYATRKTPEDPILPVADAPLDSANWTQLAATREDFALITGVSGDQRGVPDATTATQANIVNTRAQLRESKARRQVAAWLAAICRLMALTLIERMQEPIWIKSSVDPFSANLQQLATADQAWQQLHTEALGRNADGTVDFDYDIKVDIASLSPVAEDLERQQWTTVLSLLTNPALLVVLMTPNPQSPAEPSPLLRKTLGYFGIKSEAQVREIARVGQTILNNQVLQTVMAAGAKAGGLPMASAPAGQPAGIPDAAPGQAA